MPASPHAAPEALDGSRLLAHVIARGLDGASKADMFDAADTTAAIVGQIAGAFYGLAAIPEPWRARLHRGAEIEEFGRRLGRAGPALNL